MADHHLDAVLAQTRDIVVVGNVRALHFVAQCHHHVSNCTHANAANADEMNGAYVTWQSHYFFTPTLFLTTRPSTTSANLFGASGTPWAKASAAAFLSIAPLAINCIRKVANSGAFNSPCGKTQPPPAPAKSWAYRQRMEKFQRRY